MTKKVHILKEEQQPSYLVLGLVSHLSLLPLSIKLNESLYFSFHLIKPVINNTKKEFPCSRYIETDESLISYLIKNRHEGHILFPHYKQIDYILVLIGANSIETYSSLLPKLKEITTLSAELQKSKLKGLDKMLSI